MQFTPNPACRLEMVGDQWLALSPHGREVAVFDGPAARVLDHIAGGTDPLPVDLHEPAHVLESQGFITATHGATPRWSRRRLLQGGAAAVAGITMIGLPAAPAAASPGFTNAGYGGVQTPAGGSRGEPLLVTINSSTYGIHVFVAPEVSPESVTSFSVNPALPSLSIDCLMIGGGGGGGGSDTSMATTTVGGGGGGAGGVVAVGDITLTDTAIGAYSAVAGNGGPGGPGGAVAGGAAGIATPGSPSWLLGPGVPQTAAAAGGGAGGGSSALPGGSGASGGAGAGRTNAASPGGVGLAGQGNAGGSGTGNNNNRFNGGGGGGFGGVGVNAPVGFAGAGGQGATGPGGLGGFVGTANLAAINDAVAGFVVLQDAVAGGGGGGGEAAGPGTAGGGTGGDGYATPSVGIHGTGAGGGGGRVHAGARGGSGLVVIRYLAL
jgi:hypothetical protein